MLRYVPLLFLSLLLRSQNVVAQAAPASTTQPAPAKPALSPAEQKRQERQAKLLEEARQRQIDDARRQREYFAEQAEKERQREARRLEKERQKQGKTAAAPPANVATTPASTSVNPPTNRSAGAVAPTVDEKALRRAEKERSAAERERQRAEADRQRDAQRQAERSAKAARQAEKERSEAAEKAARDAERTRSRQAAQSSAPNNAPTENAGAVTPETPQRPARGGFFRRRSVENVAAGSNVAQPSRSGVPDASPDTVAVRRGWEFLPKGHLFAPILLDPLEAQTYGAVLPAYFTDGQRYRGSFVPFAFGFIKPFFRKMESATRGQEFALDVASFTQFEVYFDEIARVQRRQIVNTDYRVGLHYNLRRGVNSWRFRLYHLSSHLGDDYLIRNQLVFRRPNSVNYELLDATFSRDVQTVPGLRYYVGGGVVLRKPVERKPIAAQAGAYFRRPAYIGTSALRPVAGVDIKVWQQTGFRPGVHAGVGVEVGRTSNNLIFMLEGYHGFRPYSEFESQRTGWIGLGVYFNPI